jgi:hypothetical protein
VITLIKPNSKSVISRQDLSLSNSAIKTASVSVQALQHVKAMRSQEGGWANDVSYRNAAITLTPSSPQVFQKALPTFDWANNTNAFQRIKAMLSLQAGWDNYSAPAFSLLQVRKALSLCTIVYEYYLTRNLKFLENQPFIAPGSDGSILFEWSGQRFPIRDLEISVVDSKPDVLLEYLKSSFEGEEEGQLVFNKVQVHCLLDWLFKQ